MSGLEDVFSQLGLGARPDRPLPPAIGSLQAEIVDPPLGSVKIEDLQDRVRLWADDGESEVVAKSRLRILGQTGSMVKVDWNGDSVLLDFGTPDGALEAIQVLRPGSEPKPAPTPTPRQQPSTSVSAAIHRQLASTEGAAKAEAKVPAAPTVRVAQPEVPGAGGGLLKTALKVVVALALLAAAVVVGIGLGSRLLGGGPGAPTEERGADVVIRNEGGVDGGLEVSPFSVANPWVVNWKVEGGALSVTAIAADGTEFEVAEATGTDEGSVEFSEVGAFRLIVEADEGVQWRVIVLEPRRELSTDGQQP